MFPASQIITGSSTRAHFSPANVISLTKINDLHTLVAFAKDGLVAGLLMAANMQESRCPWQSINIVRIGWHFFGRIK